MSAHRDPRRKSFFDTPSSHGTANDDSDTEPAVPRRNKRIRRVSVGASTVFTTDDGFQYRRRQTLIQPKSSNKAENDIEPSPKSITKVDSDNIKHTAKRKSPRSFKSPLSNNDLKVKKKREPNSGYGKRLSDSVKFKKIPKKTDDCFAGSAVGDYPAYPDTSDWTPTLPEDDDETTAEFKLLNFLKQMTSFEICQASCVYLGNDHKFILDRIESVCKGFLAKANEKVLKILDETGPLKKPKVLPNPANIALQEKKKIWDNVIAVTRQELEAWEQLKARNFESESLLEEPECKVNEYLQQQNLQHLLEPIEYHEPILKGFLSSSVKADNIYKAAQASSNILSESTKIQEEIAKWVTQRSLKHIQLTTDPQTALLNVINSGAT